jgi:small subunit ribosomal protein S3
VGTAKTTYGTCGVKVWVFKGEVMAHDPMAQDKRMGSEPVSTDGEPRRDRHDRRDRRERSERSERE